MYWIPKNYSKKGTIARSTYYRWLKWENSFKKKAVDEISSLFDAVQLDVVANEGKGIPYIKHKFGWTERTENKNENKHEGKIEIVVKDTGVPLANNEKDIKLD
jgi:hypothetical protein